VTPRAGRKSRPNSRCGSLTRLEDLLCGRPITNPDLGLAAGLQRIASRVNRIEKRLLPVERGTVNPISERDGPS
jgi:hypothetical protein